MSDDPIINTDDPVEEPAEETVESLFNSVFSDLTHSDHFPLNIPMARKTGVELSSAIDSHGAKAKLTPAQINEIKTNLTAGLSGQWRNGRYNDIFDKAEQFAQALSFEGKKLGVMYPTTSLKGSGKLTGLSAVRALSSATGVGKDTDIVLPRSGIRVKVGNFKEKNILALQVELAERRLEVGRQTRGALFSADDVHLVVTIVDFILRHVIETTVRLSAENFIEELASLIVLPDIHALMIGTLAAMYPEGYPYIHRCMNPECSYTTLEDAEESEYPHLLFKYLTRYTKVVTPARFRHLHVGWNSHSIEHVKKYQEGFDDTLNKIIQTSPKTISVDLGPPSYKDYREYTTAWLTEIISMVDEALEISDAASAADTRIRRSKYLDETLNRLGLGRHGSWIRAINITDDDGTGVIDEVSDIYANLEELCKKRKLSVQLLEALDVVKLKSITSFAGIPVFDCPKCHTEQQIDNPEHPNLIPINITSYFFEIMGYRILESIQ